MFRRNRPRPQSPARRAGAPPHVFVAHDGPDGDATGLTELPSEPEAVASDRFPHPMQSHEPTEPSAEDEAAVVPMAGDGMCASPPASPENVSRTSPNDHASPRAAIRDEVLASRPDLGVEVADAISLAAYPWDAEVDPQILVPELRVVRNVHSPRLVDVASERLERLAEATARDGVSASERFREAARKLHEIDLPTEGESVGEDPLSGLDGLIQDPWGLGLWTDARVATHVRQESSEVSPDVELLGRLLRRAIVRSGSDDLGSALGLPPTMTSCASVLEAIGLPDPVVRLGTWIDSLDDRERSIVLDRMWSPDPSTLEVLGQRWGLTRERIRQMEKRLAERIESEAVAAIAHELVDLMNFDRTPIVRRELLDLRLDLVCRERHDLRDVVLALSGPWSRESGIYTWLREESADIGEVLYGLRDASGPYHVLDASDRRLDDLDEFIDENDRRSFLESIGWVYIEGFWATRDTVRSRVVAALMAIGEPATKDDIAVVSGCPERSVGSTLGNIEGIVRADKSRWGFEDLIDDAYEGIAKEIEQRIDEAGGAVDKAVLLREIPETFDVSEASVRSYLATLAFDIAEDGMVRRSDGSSYSAGPPAEVAGAGLTAAGWGQRVTLGADVLQRGYSLLLARDLPHANGVRPGDSLMVPLVLEGPDGPGSRDERVSVIWRLANTNPSVEVGRAGTALTSVGFVPGDVAVVVCTPERVIIRAVVASPRSATDMPVF